MKKIILLFACFVILGGCTNNSENINSINDENNHILDSIPAYEKGEGEEFDLNIHNETGISYIDFEKAYRLCTMFIKDYHYKAFSGIGSDSINFEKYFSNDKLLEYTRKKVVFGKRNNTLGNIQTGLYDIKWFLDGNLKYIYIELVVVYNENSGGETSSGFQFLVISKDGKLTISDWYYPFGGGVAMLDEKIRSNEVKINDPLIWEDEVWSDEILKTAEKELNSR